MRTVEERAEEFRDEYEDATGMMHEVKASIFLSILTRALKEQDKITRVSCSEAVMTYKDKDDDVIQRADLAVACLNVKAV